MLEVSCKITNNELTKIIPVNPIVNKKLNPNLQINEGLYVNLYPSCVVSQLKILILILIAIIKMNSRSYLSQYHEIYS